MSANHVLESGAHQVLVLIDGYAILHRAYHALPPLTNRYGELLNAVYGFTTMLFKVIADLKPKYLVVAFDTPKPTFRHMEYIGYQAKRPEMAEELAGQIGRVHEILQAMGIPTFEKDGFEADDVIGTLARQAVQGKRVKRQGGKKKIDKNLLAFSPSRHPALIDEVIIVTGDRDMMQLVGPRIKVYAPVKGLSESELFDEKKVEEKMGVKPSQIVDLKGLTGDSSDNYPGVPGIGPKTAVMLLKRFETLEKLYKNLKMVSRDFSPSVVAKLSQGEELAWLSQKLATISISVPLKIDLAKCEFKFTDEEKERTIKKLEELRFKSIVARLKKPEASASAKAAAGKQKEAQLKLV